MIHDDPRRLLETAGVFRHPCDLDLLLFFARHPRVLLASETLAGFLGYDMKVIARSLEGLLTAGLLMRRQTAAHAARLYVFTGGGSDAEWLPPLLQIAATRPGRRTLLALLNRGAGVQEPDGRVTEFQDGSARHAASRGGGKHGEVEDA